MDDIDTKIHAAGLSPPYELLLELEGYAAQLESVTAGRGQYSLDFSHYELVPAHVQSELINAYMPKHEEDCSRNSKRGLSNAAGRAWATPLKEMA